MFVVAVVFVVLFFVEWYQEVDAGEEYSLEPLIYLFVGVMFLAISMFFMPMEYWGFGVIILIICVIGLLYVLYIIRNP
jgi:hypothetical protein